MRCLCMLNTAVITAQLPLTHVPPAACPAEDVSSVSPLPASRVGSAVTGRLGPAAGLPPLAMPPSLVVTEAKLSNLRFARAESSGGATSSSVPDNESLGYSEREILAALT
jgi:hypothetical protein